MACVAAACKGRGTKATRTTAAATQTSTAWPTASKILSTFTCARTRSCRLDAWLGRSFDPENLDATVAALAAADGDDTTRAQIERAERTLADCKQRLARCRVALEAGTDPAVIAQWSAEVQAEQARAENDLKRARQAHAPPPGRDELESLIRDAGELVTILAYANPTDRRALYAALGLRLTYQPDLLRVVVECSPDDGDLGKSSCRRGDVNHTPKTVLRDELELQ